MKVVEAPRPSGPAIGIDLGTTHSLVAVFRDGRPQILPTALGNTLLPSVVALDDDDTLLVGETAVELAARRPDRAAARFKPDMGTDTQHTLGERSLTSVALSAMILRELKTTAERHLGTDVTRAVITVPAWFREPQRAATIEAAELAGLEVDRILNEPTAAAIAHGLHDRKRQASIAVLDLGGGTFDVTVLEVFEGVVEVLASVGDTRLGGEDFTDAVVELAQTTLGVESLSTDERARWRRRAEAAKRRLTEVAATEIDLGDGRLLSVDRDRFDEVNAPRLSRVRECIREAVVQARLPPAAIDEVLLVGGATRMPCIHDLAEDFFGRPPRDGVDVDHVVAHGAAVQTALLAKDEAVRDFVVTDVIPHSLGIEVTREHQGFRMGGYFSPILHRGTTIPVSRAEVYQKVDATQTALRFIIYQGEHRNVASNERLGELVIEGLPAGKDEDDLCPVQVRFTHDANGLLEVEASVQETREVMTTVIDRGRRGMSDAERQAAVEALQTLKVPPNELLPNRYLLERAQRLFQTLPPDDRELLDEALLRFEAALAREEPRQIEATRRDLRRVVDHIARSPLWKE